MTVQHNYVRYTIAAPPGMRHRMYPSTEDQVAYFENESIQMHLVFAGLPTGHRGVEVTKTVVQVDGHRTELLTFDGTQPPWVHTKWVEASFADVASNGERLSAVANCADTRAQTTALQMIRSIRFIPPPGRLPPIPPPPS